jgi:hypothetical protein
MVLKGLISDEAVKLQFLRSKALSGNKMHSVYQFTRTYKYYFPEWLLPQHNIFNTDLRTPEIKDLQFAENQEILLKKPWMKNLDLKNHPQVSYRYIGTINL